MQPRRVCVRVLIFGRMAVIEKCTGVSLLRLQCVDLKSNVTFVHCRKHFVWQKDENIGSTDNGGAVWNIACEGAVLRTVTPTMSHGT